MQPADELHGEAAREERILAVGLLAAAPPRVAEQIDVGGPKGQTLIPLMAAGANVLVVLGTGLVGDDGRHPEHEAVVPGGGQADRLGKARREAGARDPVQRFVPPVVLGDAQPLDRGGHILHLRDLLLERHAADEVADPHLEWELLVLVARRLRLHPARVGERVAQHSGGGEQHPFHACFRSAGEKRSLAAKND